MFSIFGTKFVKLYSGPIWRVETTAQEDQVPLSSDRSPVEVRNLNCIMPFELIFNFHFCVLSRRGLTSQDYLKERFRETLLEVMSC